MVDDEVGHHLVIAGEVDDVVPVADAGIDGRVVGGIESGVGTVDRHEEGKNVHSAEGSGEWAAEHLGHPAEIAGQAVGVGDELRTVEHRGER